MDKVKVRREELLAAVQKNRAQHRDEFLKAQEGFKARVIAELERRLEDARKGAKVELTVRLPEPTNQTKDYDRVIRMLEMSVEAEIELHDHEFAQYVMDDWDWKQGFSATNAFYSQVK